MPERCRCWWEGEEREDAEDERLFLGGCWWWWWFDERRDEEEEGEEEEKEGGVVLDDIPLVLGLCLCVWRGGSCRGEEVGGVSLDLMARLRRRDFSGRAEMR